MLLHYFKVGLRNLLKYKVFSFINLFGLAAAMSVSMLILLMLADQKSHDRFNVNKDRIYRILSDRTDFRNPSATTAVPVAAAVKAELPAVEATTHLVMGVGGDILAGATAEAGGVVRRAGRIAEARGYFADTSFFRVFSFELGEGDPATALAAPGSLVITHELAVRLFGDTDPIGRAVEWEDRGLTVFGNGSASTPVSWGTYKITGVIADRHYRSHLVFDALMSESSMSPLVQDKKIPDYKQNWQWYSNCYTYALMRPGKSGADLDAGLRRLVGRHYSGIAEFKGFSMRGQPLTRISPGILLGNEPVVALPMVAYYLLSFLAVLILVLAGLNYVNLSVARALSRAREIGVRKVSGAQRANLVLQFLGESVLTALASLGMAVVFLVVLKAAFVRLWVNQYLNFELSGGVGVYLIFVGFAVFVGVLAGLYPALRLSGIGVIPALKSNDGLGMGRLGIRKALSVVQFVFSLLFIVTSILIYNQFRYFIDFSYEFNTRNVVNVDLQNNDYRVAGKAMATIPGVAEVSACEYLPAETRSEGGSLRRPYGRFRGDKSDFKPVMTMGADEHFVDNLGLKLVAGRGLLPEGPGADRQIVVNEALVKLLGYSSPAAIVGQRLESEWNDSGEVVIGVVQDFHMRMLLGNDKIDPLYLYSNAKNYQYVNLRLATRDIRGTVDRLGVVWRKIDPVHALKYSFYSDELANQSQGIFDVVSILGFIAALAVTIACLGMLGMAMYTTERRRKEVGIRKVLGSGDFRNVVLLSREFLVVLGVAIAIAAPLSYILNEMWLRVFPNRVEFGWGTVGLGVLIVLVLGLVTIGSQTVRASRRNPVESLKVE